MLLPGPEAQKLATYIGWLLHGVRGGLAAGILFVLPGALVMLGLSLLYALGRGVPLIDGALFGIKAAVLVIVVEALIRIGKRALKTSVLLALAGAAFVGIFFFGAAVSADRRRRGADRLSGGANRAGACLACRKTDAVAHAAPATAGGSSPSPRWSASSLWWAPVALAAADARPATMCWSSIGMFFSKLAVVSFGGAYALLAYMAQQAVETHRLDDARRKWSTGSALPRPRRAR